ncbi:MAG: putative Na+/H+ antiporter [Verrucomicrobiia bacterium]
MESICEEQGNRRIARRPSWRAGRFTGAAFSLKGYFLAGILLWAVGLNVAGAALGPTAAPPFPHPLSSYPVSADASLVSVLTSRIRAEPFNLLATVLFFLAIAHTFAASSFTRLAHRIEDRHRAANPDGSAHVSFGAQVFHFLGEVEAIFGIWVVPLLGALVLIKGWGVANTYFNHRLNFTEPMFVVVIMTIAASRPIVRLVESAMAGVASLTGKTPGAWWFSILTLGPLLGSLITEPAAMTISALLLAGKIYSRAPKRVFAYATLGLLFVNVSVGGTLTHFAAPPVLMVASRWNWDMMHMLTNFGWKAAVGIVAANVVYVAVFRNELRRLAAFEPLEMEERGAPIPTWISVVHVLSLVWTVFNNHSPVMFIGGFLFYLAFTQATEPHQSAVRLRPALLVGFFLAGLVIHGGLQGWWIEPLLTRLGELPLFFGAITLTAFNDNAAITYLASLVPGFGPELQYAVVAGAVVGGGLTVIANAPNPAGQSILSRFFPDGVSAVGLLIGALPPTAIMALAFLVL